MPVRSKVTLAFANLELCQTQNYLGVVHRLDLDPKDVVSRSSLGSFVDGSYYLLDRCGVRCHHVISAGVPTSDEHDCAVFSLSDLVLCPENALEAKWRVSIKNRRGGRLDRLPDF